MSLVIKNSFPDLVQITPSIQLRLTDSKKFSQIPSITDKKIISFQISGAVSGSFYCTVDSDLSQSTLRVFAESMNILLGNTLSRLEEESGLIFDLASPLYEKNNIHDVSAKGQMTYDLEVSGKVISCFIYNDLQVQFDQQQRTNTISHSKEGVLDA